MSDYSSSVKTSLFDDVQRCSTVAPGLGRRYEMFRAGKHSGQPEHAPTGNDPVGYVFQAQGEGGDAGLAERASRLGSGDQVDIDFSGVVSGWNVARGLSGS
jgi:hypothetical protein